MSAWYVKLCEQCNMKKYNSVRVNIKIIPFTNGQSVY